MKSFKNKNIWIIGASSGIGRELAFYLDSCGANLVISARTEKSLNHLLDEMSGQHNAVAVDISDYKQVEKAFDKVKSFFKNIDSVIFMAGIYKPDKIEDMDLETAVQIVNINFVGALNLTHTVLPTLKGQEKSQIAFCSSVAAYRGLPAGQPYSATKAALTNFVETLHLELANTNIDVKLISPGFVNTPMTEQNEFKMPLVINSTLAAKEIAQGLRRKSFEIHFPKLFTYIMKFLRIMPSSLYFLLTRKIKHEG